MASTQGQREMTWSRWVAAAASAILLAIAAAAVLLTQGESALGRIDGDECGLASSEPGPVELLRQQLRCLVAEGTPGTERELALRSALGRHLLGVGRFAEAVQQFSTSASLARGDEEFVEAQRLRGEAELRQGHLWEAQLRLEAARAFLGEGDPGGAGAAAAGAPLPGAGIAIYCTLAEVLRERGHLEDALKLFTLAWEMASVPNSEGMDRLPLLAIDISEVHARGGQLEKAAAWFREASRQLKENDAVAPEESGAAAAKILSHRASLCHARGDASEAVQLYRRSWKVQARELHAGHHDLLATQLGLARALRDLGEAAAAMEAVEAAEGALRQGPGEGPGLSRALVLKADLLREGRQLEAAEALAEEAVALQRACFGGSDHPEAAVALSGWGSILHDQGKFAEAHAKYDEALQINLRTVGFKHPETASAYKRLGALYEDTGDDGEARANFQRSLVIQLATVGWKSRHVSTTYSSIAAVLFRSGEWGEAADLLRRSLQVLDAAGVPSSSPDRKLCEDNLSEVLQVMTGSECSA